MFTLDSGSVDTLGKHTERTVNRMFTGKSRKL